MRPMPPNEKRGPNGVGRLRALFSDEEIGALTATIGMINLWNRIQISAH